MNLFKSTLAAPNQNSQATTNPIGSSGADLGDSEESPPDGQHPRHEKTQHVRNEPITGKNVKLATFDFLGPLFWISHRKH